jgi:hypothetical protein
MSRMQGQHRGTGAVDPDIPTPRGNALILLTPEVAPKLPYKSTVERLISCEQGRCLPSIVESGQGARHRRIRNRAGNKKAPRGAGPELAMT